MKPRRILEDPNVQHAIEEAACKACDSLSGIFPGNDFGGIDKDFYSYLKTCIAQKLIRSNLVTLLERQ